MREYLTTRDISAQLKVSLLTVRRWIKSGKLKAIDLGKEYRIDQADFEVFLKDRQFRS